MRISISDECYWLLASCAVKEHMRPNALLEKWILEHRDEMPEKQSANWPDNGPPDEEMICMSMKLTCKSHVPEEMDLPYNWCNHPKKTAGLTLCSDEKNCPYFEARE